MRGYNRRSLLIQLVEFGAEFYGSLACDRSADVNRASTIRWLPAITLDWTELLVPTGP
ncbi:hypothetical protein H6F90_23685 [Trichocoleus sp. FACHB-591]|uniref:hypothetical protein n=1 Tax=Trichocoleus sp. FACHB-591 TaxID=2692872 RepID=UPI00168493E7|nr:hypothetical protein [Trichocoleus sp. FACHB-591]MBD2098076.1 hypothetical protein [Trichocoleus sp. FACHB-591]